MASKIKLVVLKECFLGKPGRVFLGSPLQAQSLLKSGLVRLAEEVPVTEEEPSTEGEPVEQPIEAVEPVEESIEERASEAPVKATKKKSKAK